MKMLEAKQQQRWYTETYPELQVDIVFEKGTVALRIMGRLADGQGNKIQIVEDITDVEVAKAFRTLIKEFYTVYEPRDVEEGNIKTFSFKIENNEMISWKQFSDFLAWYKIPYFVNPIAKLVTVEKDNK